MIAKLTGTKVLGYDNVDRLGSVFTKPVCWPNAAESKKAKAAGQVRPWNLAASACKERRTRPTVSDQLSDERIRDRAVCCGTERDDLRARGRAEHEPRRRRRPKPRSVDRHARVTLKRAIVHSRSSKDPAWRANDQKHLVH